MIKSAVDGELDSPLSLRRFKPAACRRVRSKGAMAPSIQGRGASNELNYVMLWLESGH